MTDPKTCSEGDGKPAFGKGLCSAHYQQDRRARLHGKEADLKAVRDYGVGHHQVSGRVNDDELELLKAEAARDFDGKMYPLIQYIVRLYLEGQK